MAKTSMICPFSNKLCVECELYRGRHYFLCFSKKYRGYLGPLKESDQLNRAADSIDFKTLEKRANPWTNTNSLSGDEPEIKLKVVDSESKKERYCRVDETKSWDWNNPKIMRIIDGRHITSWNNLVEILNYKAKNGCHEVELHEGPRFILLAGG